jgi:hypothetical protein
MDVLRADINQMFASRSRKKYGTEKSFRCGPSSQYNMEQARCTSKLI